MLQKETFIEKLTVLQRTDYRGRNTDYRGLITEHRLRKTDYKLQRMEKLDLECEFKPYNDKVGLNLNSSKFDLFVILSFRRKRPNGLQDVAVAKKSLVILNLSKETQISCHIEAK